MKKANLARPFGVELEISGGYCGQADASHDAYIEIYDRRGYSKGIYIKLLPGWKSHHDGSCGPEFVSPPLLTMEPVYTQIRRIKDAIEPVAPIKFDSCGLHVHVGATDLDEAGVVNVARFCRYFDRAIASFFHPNREKTTYCKRIGLSTQKIADALNRRAVDRYRGCNIAAWYKHGTIEFRYSEGHLDENKLTAMVHLYVGIVEYVAENPKFNLGCKPNLEAKRSYLLETINLEQRFRDVLLGARY